MLYDIILPDLSTSFYCYLVLYAKSTHLENIFPQYTPCQQLIQIKPAFYGSYLTCNMPHSSDAIIWVFHLS